MPCYSRITNTKMNIAANLASALRALGYSVRAVSENHIDGVHLDKGPVTFYRGSNADNFRTTSTGETVAAIGRKYAEVGVRAWAERNRFSVSDNDGVTMTLKQRGVV